MEAQWGFGKLSRQLLGEARKLTNYRLSRAQGEIEQVAPRGMRQGKGYRPRNL